MTPKEIEAARKTLGMNKSEFCRTLGIARTTLDFWEKGTHRPMLVFEKMIERMLYAKSRVRKS